MKLDDHLIPVLILSQDQELGPLWEEIHAEATQKLSELRAMADRIAETTSERLKSKMTEMLDVAAKRSMPDGIKLGKTHKLTVAPAGTLALHPLGDTECRCPMCRFKRLFSRKD